MGEFPGDGRVEYKEDMFVGYRYFATHKKEVVFPFGYGLSYTTFEFSDLKIVKSEEAVNVGLTVTNSGEREGAEVVQIYLHDKDPAMERPDQELKGFEKVRLKAGESATVEIKLDHSAFSRFDPQRREWVPGSGSFQVRVGSSSRDMKLTADLVL